jgi:hypothetical protein
MKPLFTLQKKPNDVYALSIFLVVISIVFSLTQLYNLPKGDLFVSVYVESKLVEQYDLYEDANIEFLPDDHPSLLGPLTLAIQNQRIKIIEETSPLNICSQQGWVETPGLPLVCAPNFFLAVIETLQ